MRATNVSRCAEVWIFLFLVIALVATPLVASAKPGGGGHAITICHRTDSETNPYVRKTVDASSTDVAGHEGHIGDLWYNGHPKEPKWGDIIPPTDDDGDLAVTPLNWSAMGQAMWHNNCQSPYGPPPGQPTITCNFISIDPPSGSYIQVTFIGTINGVPFSRSVAYGSPTPHIAEVDISDLTTASGRCTSRRTRFGPWGRVSHTPPT
jgi:hypothetical protein